MKFHIVLEIGRFFLQYPKPDPDPPLFWPSTSSSYWVQTTPQFRDSEVENGTRR